MHVKKQVTVIDMRTLKKYCREHRIGQRRLLWLGLIIFGDDLLLVLLLAVSHYLHLGNGVWM